MVYFLPSLLAFTQSTLTVWCFALSVHENMVMNLVQGFLSSLLIMGAGMTTLVGCVACLWYIVTPS